MNELINAVQSNPSLATIGAASIALFGVLGGVLSGYLQNSKSIYLDKVTGQRIDWIAELKAHISSYIHDLNRIEVIYQFNQRNERAEEIEKLFSKSRKTLAQISLHLNPFGEIEKNVLEALRLMPVFLVRSRLEDYRKSRDLLVQHSQYLFKGEWEVVKFESSSLLGKAICTMKKARRDKEYKEFSTKHDGLQSLAALSAEIGTKEKAKKKRKSSEPGA